MQALPLAGLTGALFSTPAMRETFSARACVQRMLDFEAALARAQARTGVIPSACAAPIAAACDAAHIDTEQLAQAAALAGNLAIPLVRQLTAVVAATDPEAARFVHWGATSQDAIDTGLVLQMRDALDLIDTDLASLSSALAALASRHRDTVMAGRTWMQHALPVSFGLKAAGWLDGVQRHRERLAALRPRLLVLQFGGAAGTLASLGGKGLAVAQALADELGLGLPAMPWHGQRDSLAEAAAVLGMLTGSLGKMARDIALLTQTEVGEAAEPAAEGKGGSSTMPHKQNPVGCAAVLAAAARVPALVSTMLSAMVQEHERALGGWQAEWDSLPDIVLLAAGALRQATTMAEGLTVNPQRMRANLDTTGGLIMAEAVALALGARLGRLQAHELVEAACRRAVQSGRPLREVLREDSAVAAQLSPQQIDSLLEPTGYLGQSGAFIDRVLAAQPPRTLRE
ncbi:3-carboxy-cis,cis-muconate cycloisomerase [Noviherbaspirillum aridicola]|uniref:3-carboxy-cis,cis-muconate cycloisomerase n=1 Tax=Noviherbaspirillum aridicola TaxID=2849687 RepID=A0ABQ4Q154_9BURK|nr:3-carboxy-cis,cis-muconate cycloisomerase [Noviherbaspirillum aridicola]GIZ50555.1 3-carboxy-cis,cis-muconate cycloisomerase [Noviherbaspirillum aridicola]